MVQGNLIGTDVTGTLAPGNGVGVFLTNEASNNTIGGTASGAGNTIAHNIIGVSVWSGKGNGILSNSIFSNDSLGIDLYLTSQNVTPNDPGDIDAGANNVQNFPVLSSAFGDGDDTSVSGDLNSTADTTFRIEFFSNAVKDPTGHGEGETFLGFTETTTDAFGDASFSIQVDAAPVGHFVTATATDPGNNTSEFSEAVAVEAAVFPIEINDSLVASEVRTSYNPIPATNAPAGVFTISATFTNTLPESFFDMFFDVAVLSGGNLILNCDGGPAGVGCGVLVPDTALGPDILLSPGESFSVEFEVGLRTASPFEFIVNAWGVGIE